MTEEIRSGWLIRLGAKAEDCGYWVRLAPEVGACQGIHEGDGVLLERDGLIVAVATVYLRRYEDASTLICYEKLRRASEGDRWLTLFEDSGMTVERLSWENFDRFVKRALNYGPEALVPIELDKAHGRDVRRYMRQLMVWAMQDDLIGPAGGPNEEIIDANVRERYAMARLAPKKRVEEAESVEVEGEDNEFAPEKDKRKHAPESKRSSMTEDEADEDVVDAKTRLAERMAPSSMGMTFYVADTVDKLHFDVTWGHYIKDEPFIDEYEKDGEMRERSLKQWHREAHRFSSDLVLESGLHRLDQPDVCLELRVRARDGLRYVSVFLINNQVETKQNRDETWVFQPRICVTGCEGAPIVCPPFESPVVEKDEEILALNMMYRENVVFAVGHGVSVHVDHGDLQNPREARSISTTFMPMYEVPTTDQPNGEDAPVFERLAHFFDMAQMADLCTPERRHELIAGLNDMADAYAEWIEAQTAKAIDDTFEDAQYAVEVDCRDMLDRLRAGISVLEQDDNALRAFGFMHRAMYEQRLHGLAIRRRRAQEGMSLEFALAEVRQHEHIEWRPFQVAFILLLVPSLTDPTHDERTNPDVSAQPADLLWFPTGGGKTEAYLGAAAFAMAIRRLQGNVGGYDGNEGLCVLMRCTLRLLTVQQLQRAAALICAMETIRLKAPEVWGRERFTLGIWIGSKATPNKTKDGADAIRALRENKGYSTQPVPNQLTTCPWCGADINPVNDIDVDEDCLKTRVFCGDVRSECAFCKRHNPDGLPIVSVDEEIYHRPPTMMIATVDKFAQMAWQGDVSTLFGRASGRCERHGLVWPGCDSCDGHQFHAAKGAALPRAEIMMNAPKIRPIDLIIQDEFHLISGPLGTLVGLYETVVDALCTWQVGDKYVHPRIIASTATVRKARDQIKGVFNRQVEIFPPHGVDVKDNFFSVQRPVEEKSGRLYVGVSSPGTALPAIEVRIYVALMAAAKSLFDAFGHKLADPYMTLVGYFNAIRSLSSMRRRCEDVVFTRVSHVDQLRDKKGRPIRVGLKPRRIRQPLELTSRITSTNIPAMLGELEIPFTREMFEVPDTVDLPAPKGSKSKKAVGLDVFKQAIKTEKQFVKKAVDIVLATNMLSVGVDVNRLGLMVVDGQPKNTAEYIQATSRVGRQHPGLVVTLLNWARPRDFSHYETFEDYHAAFYRHVEAQSVTPFAKRAIDRGLFGLLVSLIRHTDTHYTANDGANKVNEVNCSVALDAIECIRQRVSSVKQSPKVTQSVQEAARARLDNWVKETVQSSLCYRESRNSGDKKALMRTPDANAWSEWTVPNTMREVEPDVPLIIPADGVEFWDNYIDSDHPWCASAKEK